MTWFDAAVTASADRAWTMMVSSSSPPPVQVAARGAERHDRDVVLLAGGLDHADHRKTARPIRTSWPSAAAALPPNSSVTGLGPSTTTLASVRSSCASNRAPPSARGR